MKKIFSLLFLIFIFTPLSLEAKTNNSNSCIVDIPEKITNILCRNEDNKELFFNMQLYKAKLQNTQIDLYNIIKISDDYNFFLSNLNKCFNNENNNVSETCITTKIKEKTEYYKTIKFIGGNERN